MIKLSEKHNKKNETCAFSISLENKENLPKVSYGKEFGPKVTIDGNLGKIEKVKINDEVILQIKGSKGVINIDFPKDMLNKLCSKKEVK